MKEYKRATIGFTNGETKQIGNIRVDSIDFDKDMIAFEYIDIIFGDIRTVNLIKRNINYIVFTDEEEVEQS